MDESLSFENKYKAILNKESQLDGVFYTAVKTTGIFCRPSCTARKPKAENVEFFDSIHDAMINGYRPCKVCKPMDTSKKMPGSIANLLVEFEKEPFVKIKDSDLARIGIEPNSVRRWFKKNFGMTFQAYQRLFRINTAFQQIRNGDSITNSAFDSGYNSISGFNHSYKKIFAKAAKFKTDKNVISITRIDTPIGPMFGAATDSGICLLEFTDRKMLETEFEDIGKRLDAIILPGMNDHLAQLKLELKQYFDGVRTSFDVNLCLTGTEFQVTVWNLLQTIPYGKTWSYQQQAKELKNPKSIRAVASANGRNKISIIVPCHRVIGSDGTLTGYGGGLARKKWLLDLEKKHSDEPVQSELKF
jgi:AraC family transcriptional regulator of adaptative response/methylated-DNA-[protein]-cysteine methyltransferase